MAASDQAELTIDLAALAANYKTMQKNAGKAEASAVVKANGYGLGMAEIAPTLFDIGCQSFWVAQLNEGIALRTILPKAKIYVLNGLPGGTAAQFEAHDLRPCLITLAQVEEWQNYCQPTSPFPPAYLSIAALTGWALVRLKLLNSLLGLVFLEGGNYA